MASSIQLLRSTIAQERPFPGNLLEGQPAVNLNTTEPGLFFKAADGSLVKFGPAAITSDGSPPNSSPQGLAGNTIGELWLDKSVNPAVLKVYDGTAWVDAGSGGGGGGGTASFVRWIYTAIGGETSLSGSSGGVLLEYTPGLEEVYVNGVLITRGMDYSATNGTSITNLSALTAGDVITVMSLNPAETVQLPGQVTRDAVTQELSTSYSWSATSEEIILCDKTAVPTTSDQAAVAGGTITVSFAGRNTAGARTSGYAEFSFQTDNDGNETITRTVMFSQGSRTVDLNLIRSGSNYTLTTTPNSDSISGGTVSVHVKYTKTVNVPGFDIDVSLLK